MCEVLSQVACHVPNLPEPTRRRFLQALGVGTIATGLGTIAEGPAAATKPFHSNGHRTELVLLGTAGGPALFGGGRFGTSTAISFAGQVYLVDLGAGSFLRLQQSELAPSQPGVPNTLSPVKGIFFTHLHSDHTTDWPAMYVTGPTNAISRPHGPVAVRGPGPRGTLPRVYPPGRPAPAVIHPEDPTPGITAMTDHISRAYAQDLNDRARDSNFADPAVLFDVRDIDLAEIWTVDAEGRPPRLDAPIPVLEDGDVRVTATLVDHHPTAPAFAYRFDTPDGSVVISGDTTVSDNLIDLAKGADYLVHEVIDPAFVDGIASSLPPDVAGPLRAHLLEAHTTIEQVGRDVAEPAAVKNLVLTHLVPGSAPRARWQKAQRGYSGRLIVGEDLMRLGVGHR
jgi:ribonuclease BN (tRNA processing enzyme)